MDVKVSVYAVAAASARSKHDYNDKMMEVMMIMMMMVVMDMVTAAKLAMAPTLIVLNAGKLNFLKRQHSRSSQPEF